MEAPNKKDLKGSIDLRNASACESNNIKVR
jgi:hypothetical protein